jgi:ribosomal protein S18 acetylase RimI-like enzyme
VAVGGLAADPGDVAAVVALLDACDTAAVGQPDSGADEVSGLLASEQTDHEATVLVRRGDALVGFVWVERDRGAAQTWVDVYVHPVDGDDALRDAAFAHGLEAARRHRAEAQASAWSLRAGCFASDEPLVRACERAGFERVRRFWRMRIDLTSSAVPEQPPALPPGVDLVVARTRADRQRCHAVRDSAFADHWHNVPRDFDDWMAQNDAAAEDPDGWWLLTVDGVDAAICLLDDSRLEHGGGYVRTLGVRPGHRGRGLARLLLRRAFVRYRDLGRSGVELSVDSENTTGALRLYEDVGMRVHRVIDAWSRSAT